MLFVAIMVTSFVRPISMVFLFALVTGMTVWEYCGLVSEWDDIQVNRFISTVSGVYLFVAMAGYCTGYTTSTVFIPYLVTILYLIIVELFTQAVNGMTFNLRHVPSSPVVTLGKWLVYRIIV